MPSAFPLELRLRVREYLRLAGTPSRGEIRAAAGVLHHQLRQAIEADDQEAAATAAEKVSEAIGAELHRLTPGGIPTPADLRDPQHGIERAKELLGCCVAGAEIVPGRRRANGRRSRSTLKLVPRFTQGRGFPRQDPEMMLARSLAEYYRDFNRGRFPRSCAHDDSKSFSPFERLVDEVLRTCGVCGVCTRKLVRRALEEIRDSELSTKKGRFGPARTAGYVRSPLGIIPGELKV